jgi:hypothetical protein
MANLNIKEAAHANMSSHAIIDEAAEPLRKRLLPYVESDAKLYG